jgi:hypothetical protein
MSSHLYRALAAVIIPLSLLTVIETFMPGKRQQFCGDLLHCVLHKRSDLTQVFIQYESQ